MKRQRAQAERWAGAFVASTEDNGQDSKRLGMGTFELQWALGVGAAVCLALGVMQAGESVAWLDKKGI